MHTKTVIHTTASLIAALLILTFSTGCQLPSYSLNNPGEPSDALTEFIDAVNRKDDSRINDLLYHGSWSDATEDAFSDADQELSDVLAESRCITITNQHFRDSSGNSARLSFILTSFDISLFEKALTKEVEKDVKTQMFEGKTFSTSSDTEEIIDYHKHELLKNPERFYSDAEFTVDMTLSNGTWRVELTDELYNALLGLR